MSRRRFLAAAAVAAPAALVPLRPWRVAVEVVGPPPAARRLPALLADRDSARALGREYLRGTRASAGELVAALTADLPGGAAALRRAGDDELRALLAARAHGDFAEGAVVELRGWVVSCTEARLCALAALA